MIGRQLKDADEQREGRAWVRRCRGNMFRGIEAQGVLAEAWKNRLDMGMKRELHKMLSF